MRGNPAFQTAALGLMFDVQGTLVNIAVALGASSLGSWLRTHGEHSGRVLGRVTGMLFIGLGARLAWKRG